MHHRDRHERAVGCRGPLPVLGVVRDVEVAEHRLALEERAIAGREVDVEHGARGGPRLDDDLDGALGRLGVVAQADRVHRLLDGDVPRLAVPRGRGRVPRQHAQRGEPTRAQAEHGGVVERVDGHEPLALPRAQPRHPLFVGRGVERGPGEVGVGRVGVVHDEEAVGGRLDVVLDPLAARGQHPPLPLRVVGVEDVHLGGRLRPQPQQQPPLVAAGGHAHPEALVVLLVHQDVVGRVAADPVPPQLVRPPRLVEPGVEHELPVAAQLDAVADAGDRGVEDVTGGDVADGQVEALVARGVDRERHEPVVGADGERPQREELAVTRFDVAVDDDLLPRHGIRLGVGSHGRVGQRRPHLGGVLEALDGAGVVPPRAARDGHRQVGLLHPRADLLDDRTCAAA